MKLIIFVVVFIAAMAFIPDSLPGSFLDGHISISGDGEEAMNKFEFTVIIFKAALSTEISLIALWLYGKRRR